MLRNPLEGETFLGDKGENETNLMICLLNEEAFLLLPRREGTFTT